MTMTNEEMMAQWAEADKRRAPIVAQLVAEGVPFVSAIIIAGDRDGAEHWHQRVLDGSLEPMEAVNLTGSYARLDQALRLIDEGRLTVDEVLAELPELWRGSDPDDTSPRFLHLWQQAKRANGGYVRDGRPLPRTSQLTVYRGQMPTDPVGMAWTLDPKVAEKFARGAGLRQHNMAGTVLRGTVRRSDVLAYLTGRGESEVVVDPLLVQKG